MSDDREATDDRSSSERGRSENREPSGTGETTPTGTMSDITTDPETEAASTANHHAGEPTAERSESGSDVLGGDRLTTERLRGILDRVGLAALVVLALIAGWSFYGHAGAAIRTWIDPAYQPVALAAFNLTVLLVALAGVSHQLSRIRESERDDGTEGAAGRTTSE